MIFLAEQREVGRDLREQLRHHGGDAAEKCGRNLSPVRHSALPAGSMRWRIRPDTSSRPTVPTPDRPWPRLTPLCLFIHWITAEHDHIGACAGHRLRGFETLGVALGHLIFGPLGCQRSDRQRRDHQRDARGRHPVEFRTEDFGDKRGRAVADACAVAVHKPARQSLVELIKSWRGAIYSNCRPVPRTAAEHLGDN